MRVTRRAQSAARSPVAGEKRGPRTPTSAEKAAEEKRVAAEPVARRSSRSASARIRAVVGGDEDGAADAFKAAADLMGFGEAWRSCEPCNEPSPNLMDTEPPEPPPPAPPPPAPPTPGPLQEWDRHHGVSGGSSESHASRAGDEVDDVLFKRCTLVRAGRDESGFNKASTPLQCWGYELMHLVVHAHAPATVCQPISSSCNTSTFRDKFCSTCSAAMLLPLSHVRALPLALEGQFCNGKGIGLWSHAPSAPNTCFRVINQTAKCHGPKLVVFHERPDGVDLDWDPIPSNWLEDGMLPVVVAKGTLVPTRALVRLPAVGMWAPAMASLTGAVNLTSANKGPAEHAWSCYSARGIKRLGWDAGGEGADGKEEAIKRQVSAVLDGNGGVRHAAPIPVLARLHSAPVHARPLIWEPVHTASLARALGFAPPLPREQMHTAPLHSAQARTAPLSLPPPPPHETCISGLPVGKAVRKAVRVRMREIGSSRGILAPLPQSKEELLRLADSKLMPAGMRAQRIFLGADEISSDTFGLIQNDDIIYISAGENWIAPPSTESPGADTPLPLGMGVHSTDPTSLTTGTNPTAGTSLTRPQELHFTRLYPSPPCSPAGTAEDVKQRQLPARRWLLLTKWLKQGQQALRKDSVRTQTVGLTVAAVAMYAAAAGRNTNLLIPVGVALLFGMLAVAVHYLSGKALARIWAFIGITGALVNMLVAPFQSDADLLDYVQTQPQRIAGLQIGMLAIGSMHAMFQFSVRLKLGIAAWVFACAICQNALIYYRVDELAFASRECLCVIIPFTTGMGITELAFRSVRGHVMNADTAVGVGV